MAKDKAAREERPPAADRLLVEPAGEARRGGPPPLPAAAKSDANPMLPALPGSPPTSPILPGAAGVLAPSGPPKSAAIGSLAELLANERPGAERQDAGDTGEARLQALPAEADPSMSGATGLAVSPDQSNLAGRRKAQRRPAGPSRERLAANDDTPTIGGLIYALNQKPSADPFRTAAWASAAWLVVGLGFAWVVIGAEVAKARGFGDLIASSTLLTTFAAIVFPVVLFWFLALLLWRSEELKLRASAMTEVAVRLAEPDRGAEQSIASLGQAVRRQVSFMNEAVERALGRAGELEALVHNEVASLDRAYEENERRIRGLIQELAGERNALQSTSERVHETLMAIGSEVPALIDKLTGQQQKLTGIVASASQNLTQLETAIGNQTGRLEGAISSRTQELQTVLEGYTTALSDALGNRAKQLHGLLEGHLSAVGETLDHSLVAIADQTERVTGSLDARTGEIVTAMDERVQRIASSLESSQKAVAATIDGRSAALLGDVDRRVEALLGGVDSRAAALLGGVDSRAAALLGGVDKRGQEITRELERQGQSLDTRLAAYLEQMDTSIADRTEQLQSVFEEYVKALDSTLANRAQTLDTQLIERTRALDGAFTDRLRLFDESIMRSTLAIDSTLGENARAVTSAMETHAHTMSQTIAKQASELDETLMSGITAVRRTSENITRQSLKAIEGLAGQADLLKTVSENLLSQINTTTNRFESQGQTIMRAANALETANYKIDSTLQNRQNELSQTLERLTGKVDNLDRTMATYQTSIEGSLTTAEQRTRQITDELARSTDQRSRSTIEQIERLKHETTHQTDRALDDLRTRFTSVQREVSEQLGSITSHIDQTSSSLRDRAQRAAAEIESEQARLRQQMEALPTATREGTEAVRKALSDQLRALDQLSSLTTREAARRDIAPPAEPPAPPPAGTLALPPPREPRPRNLTTLTSTLAYEMAQRQRPQPPEAQAPLPPPATAPAAQPPAAPVAAAAPPVQPPVGQPAAAAGIEMRDGWKLGDLLKRASLDEDASQPRAAAPVGAARAYPAPAPAASLTPQPAPPTAAPPPTAARPAPPAPAAAGPLLNIEALSRAIDGPTAASIWNRFRAGQRGFMVRSIYSEPSRALFDELHARYRADAGFQGVVNRYLVEFEGILRAAEARDPGGPALQGHLVSDMGRVYLLLAHASGRLS